MPTERISRRYARLFELRVLHHFWLDDGATLFDALPAATQEQRLLDYDVRRIFEIAPTPASATALAGLQATWRATSLGLLVGLPDDVVVPDESVFELTLRVVDPDFASITAYGLRMPSSADVQEAAGPGVWRYRAGAATYSSLTGCARGAGAARQLFLSREAPARQAADLVESIVNDGGALVQLTSDPPTSATATLGPAAANLPGFATHADVLAITPPAGLAGSPPAAGLQLPDGAPADTFALVRVAAVHPTDADFSCTAGGVARAAPPIFQLRFATRRTLWRRLKATSPSTLVSESGPFPLTWRGNPSTGSKPVTRSVKLDLAGTAVKNIVSEIFV